MSFTSAVVIAGFGLVLLISITYFLISRIIKKSFSISFAIAHFIFILLLSAIYFPGEKDAQHQLFWIIPAILNIPISFIYPILSMGNMITLAVTFAVLGTVQYGIIGWLIDLLLSKNKRELFPTKRFVVPFLLLVGFVTVWGYRNITYINLPESEKLEIQLREAKSEIDKTYILDEAAKINFEEKKYKKAEQYAIELLNLAHKYPNKGNYGNAIYDSHLVLGRLALLADDFESAKKHLFSAVKTPGSPTLNSFGPNMSLAKDLLKKGHKTSVVEFLNQCKNLWYDHKKVDKWIIEINAGKIPDFGANLVY